MAVDNPITTEDLTLANVPSPEADLQVLEEFCLTIDGYQGERFSIDYLLNAAAQEHLAREVYERVRATDAPEIQ